MAESILVGVDASTPSRSAIRWSVSRALATGAALELLHVIVGETHDDAARLLHGELEFVRTLAPNLTVTTTLADGDAEDAFVRRSGRHSLLVVGTHKTGFIYGRAFGSRFLGLAARARCAVAFIPDQGGVVRRSVVAGVESSPVGDAVIQFAAAEAERGGNELTLVGNTRDATARASQLVRELHPELRFRTRVTELPLAEALVDASTQSALLVIGRPRTGSASAVADNHDVLVNMGCPVMVLCTA